MTESELKDYIDKSIITVEKHIGALRCEQDKRIEKMFDALEKAVKIQATQLEIRLGLHNELLQKMKDTEEKFASKESVELLRISVSNLRTHVDKGGAIITAIVALITGIAAIVITLLG